MSDLPTTIAVFPLPNVVLFPDVMLPLHIFEPRYRQMVRDAHDKTPALIGMALLRGDWAHADALAAKQVVLWIGANDLPEIRKNLSWEWQEPIPVPNSLRRLILVGTKKL